MTEIWESIIDCVVVEYTPEDGATYRDHLDLRRDLSSCALVCRAWRVRAQMHLFAFLRIEGDALSRYEALIRKTPVLCSFAKELMFYNEYVDKSKDGVTGKTVETASHVVRITHRLSNVHHLLMEQINLAVEHPHLPRHMAALTNINQLDFIGHIPTKLSQLTHILIGPKNLSVLYLDVPIIVDSNPIPTARYSPKASLTRLYLAIQPGGHLLLDWLVKAKSFTTSLQRLNVVLQDQILQSEITLVIRGIQSLLDNCTGSLKEWNMWAKVRVDDLSSLPKGNVVLQCCIHPLISVLVSLEFHKSLSKLEVVVSKTWFRHALEQIKSTTSKHITQIRLWHCLDEEDEALNDLWKELDVILGTDVFKSLISVEVACVYEDSNYVLRYVKNFDKSEFATLLPTIFKKGILRCSGM